MLLFDFTLFFPQGTPFDLPEYQARNKQEIIQVLNDAETAVQTAKDYNQISDNYLLSTILSHWCNSALECQRDGSLYKSRGDWLHLQV